MCSTKLSGNHAHMTENLVRLILSRMMLALEKNKVGRGGERERFPSISQSALASLDLVCANEREGLDDRYGRRPGASEIFFQRKSVDLTLEVLVYTRRQGLRGVRPYLLNVFIRAKSYFADCQRRIRPGDFVQNLIELEKSLGSVFPRLTLLPKVSETWAPLLKIIICHLPLNSPKEVQNVSLTSASAFVLELEISTCWERTALALKRTIKGTIDGSWIRNLAGKDAISLSISFSIPSTVSLGFVRKVRIGKDSIACRSMTTAVESTQNLDPIILTLILKLPTKTLLIPW